MQKRAKANILGCQVDMVTAGDSLARIEELIHRGRPAQVITLNAEIIYQAQTNPELKDIINGADLVTPDGIGVVWGGRQLGYDIEERVTGIDLLLSLCQEAPARAWTVYFLGSAPGVAEKAAQQLCSDFPDLQVCGSHHGYFSEDDIPALINEIKTVQPHILFVSLGAPKQEKWIKKYMEQLERPVCVGVGGSLDVIAGQKKRAPGWIIKLNLEWLYRLLAEPSRFRRQLVLPKFVALILSSKHQRN
ncbi:MAG: WecB/TagA/CpsF family glycosyltransferase [Syntrophomonas sp.]|nr:WecB/TagA/CpsF family glycosyltransferase [Syntrophomonas sp.]